MAEKAITKVDNQVEYWGRSESQVNKFLGQAPRTKKSPASNANLDYVPIYEVENRLDQLFGKFGWFWQTKSVTTELNSVIVFGAIWIRQGEQFVEYMSGVGAAPLQFDDYWRRNAQGRVIVVDNVPQKSRELKYDAQAMKTNAFQIAAPSANSFALSNAASRIGKVFGRNLNGRDFADIKDVEKTVNNNISEKTEAINNLFGKE